MSQNDFICGLCGGKHWWIKKWTEGDPGWYVLCALCHELYQLMPDGKIVTLQFWERA
jgi:hypothetical protein